MNAKQRKTIEKIFEKPVRSDVKWKEIESLFISLGAIIKEGNGSRVRIQLKNIRATIHKPHPRSEIDKGALLEIKRILIEAGYYEETD